MMAKFCEDHEIKPFRCMPLRTSWIPAHMQIDTKILATQMLKKKPNNIDFDSDLWKQVVNFQSKPLQNQGTDNQGQSSSIPDVEICYIVCIRTAPVSYTVQEVETTYQNEVKACEAKLSKHPAATVYIPKFLLYMKTRCEVSAIMSRHYQSLIYLKLRFRSYLYKKQADDKLAKAIRDQFGEDPVLIIGNWSARSSTMNKYHEPARGIGLSRMLRNKRFHVYLIDEFKTSSLCPDCAQRLETFKMVKNPRPYRRAKMPQVICHGLLRSVFSRYLRPELQDYIQ
ncbi:hypothetical protein VTP01DRAFT_5911 [Rhizomucor pusillus]|uniref:uncharacterized protein n=1 Tax=Rhizomucor pusillus TaxID=4840 RepID=UPI00374385A0